MGKQLSEQAETVFELAEQESRNLNHQFVGTEHLLLALLQEKAGLSGDVLQALGLSADKVRREIEKLVTRGPEMIAADKLPFTPRVKMVIEYAEQEVMLVHQKQISAEHLLLGLFREPDGVAAKVLEILGFKLTEVRAEVLRIRLTQMKLVESVVRSLRAGTARKRKMREELLAHFESIYSEEQDRLNDPEAAMKAASERFGNPTELTREFEKALPVSERRAHWIERWFGWRAPESAERYMMRQAALLFAIMGIVFCIPAVMLLVKGADWAAWRELRTLAALLVLTPLDQFLLGVLYFKMRDALFGPPWARKSQLRALLLDIQIMIVVLGSGVAFITTANDDFGRAIQYLPLFGGIGVLIAIWYYLAARWHGPVQISDTCWACLKLENAQ